MYETGKKYPVIYADPCWRHEARGKNGNKRSQERHYPTMTTKDICDIGVKALAEKPSALFLWVTMPRLPDAIEVGKAWGFIYSTVAFVWIKTTKKNATANFMTTLDDPGLWHMGMGYNTRANAELCLLFKRGGSPPLLRQDIRQLVVAPVLRHSQKPDIVRQRIDQMYAGEKIELFARESVAGWDCIGNEIDGRDIRDVLPQRRAENQS